ncbi:type IV pilus modification PilV family protein [Roseateles sp. LKC17W]|uniref:Prepilin-type N-terminal cleavage/methylation domain-containing protein n=1 Tax=Pelomonas margarita TaxID=3299031 RepID=A0ABW7FIM9_9BURK
MMLRRPMSAQRGVTLIEALVALVVMSFGMVALVGLLGNLRYSGDIAKQRGEAMRIAQAELELLRSFSTLTKPAGAAANIRDYDQDLLPAVAARTVPAENTNTVFQLARTVRPLVQGVTLPAGVNEPQTLRAQAVSVTVGWEDRSGAQQQLVLDTIISRAAPVFSLAMGVAPPSSGLRLPDKRNPVIPQSAKDLGNGASAFRPGGGSSAVWVFNNRTGVITGVCEIPVDQAVSTLMASDVESCRNNTVGYLVSGTIRFSLGDTPDATAPQSTALPQPLNASLNLTPSQFKTRRNGVLVLAPGGDYPVSPNHVCFSDAPEAGATTRTAVNYSCLVHPNTQSPRNWWGQLLLTGLSLGATSSTYKVCRYSADYNGNGYTHIPTTDPEGLDKIDNEEHPAAYQRVSYSLARQNFLVVRGDAVCPGAPAPDASAGVFVDYSTVQMQP